MTIIYDDTGRHEVFYEPRKKRAPARALRFGAIKVGDQLTQNPRWVSAISRGACNLPNYYLVTDVWFDPVAGQHDHVAGEMVAIAMIRPDGTCTRKRSHTKRGLASQGYRYCDFDYIERTKAITAALKIGTVVGIGSRKGRKC